jgi:Domain of unknown function (DUF4375)
MDHAEIMNGCSDKAERVGLAGLNAAERVVHLASWANFEIENGGMWQFFDNSAGDHAAETVTALETVGAVRAAAALKAAMAGFPGGSPSADREERFAGLQAVSESLNSFDREFYAESPDVFSRVCSFIEAHAADLREYDTTT